MMYRRILPVLPKYFPMKGKDQSDSDVRASQEEARAQEQRSAIALAERIAAGDSAAEQQLVERYSRPLLFMLKRRCGDPELANDLHQEVFSVVLQRLRAGTIKDPARLAGFIQSTGRNLLIGVIRRRQRRQTYADSDTIAIAADEGGQDQFGEINADQVAENVRTMLEELGSERDRAILTRFYLQQEDKQSICSALELSDLHFNRVLYRAKKRFRELLQKSDRDIARDLSEGRGE